VSLFTKRREEFLFAMALRTTIEVGDMGKTVKDIKVVTKGANERMKLLLEVFEILISPEQFEVLNLLSRTSPR